MSKVTLALEALEDMHIVGLAIEDLQNWNKAVTFLRQAIDAAEQHTEAAVAEQHKKQRSANEHLEPVAWMYPDALCDKACLYLCTKGFTQFPECATTPPQRTWVNATTWRGLTDEEIEEIFNKSAGYCRDDFRSFARAIEAAHGIKGDTHE